MAVWDEINKLDSESEDEDDNNDGDDTGTGISEEEASEAGAKLVRVFLASNDIDEAVDSLEVVLKPHRHQAASSSCLVWRNMMRMLVV